MGSRSLNPFLIRHAHPLDEPLVELPRRVVAQALQLLVERRDLDQPRNVTTGPDGNDDVRHVDPDDRVRLPLEPDAVDPDDVAMLEDLVLAAQATYNALVTPQLLPAVQACDANDKLNAARTANVSPKGMLRAASP